MAKQHKHKATVETAIESEVSALPIETAIESEVEKPLFAGKYAPRIVKRGVAELENMPLPRFKQSASVLVLGNSSPKNTGRVSVFSELLGLYKSLASEGDTVTGAQLVNAMVAHNWQSGQSSQYLVARATGRKAIADWCIGYLQGAVRFNYLAVK